MSRASQLQRYVPLYAQTYARNMGRNLAPGRGQSLEGVLMFLDISGFTAMTESFAQSGDEGAEMVRDVLSDYFTQLLDIIESHGGDVLKFAGDAILVLFVGDKSIPSLKEVCLQAIACSLSACSFEFKPKREHVHMELIRSLTLTNRVGLGVGPMQAFTAGALDRLEFMVSGEPLDQVGPCIDEAATKTTVVSPEVWALVADACKVGSDSGKDGKPITGGRRHVVSVGSFEPVVRPTCRDAATAVGPDAATAAAGGGPQRGPPPSSPADALWSAFVQEPVRLSLADGLSDAAVLRTATIMFVNLPSIAPSASNAPQLMQRAVAIAVRELQRTGGSLRQAIIDDKGSVLIGAFGLPYMSKEENYGLEVPTAIRVYRGLRNARIQCTIGMTTGRVFIGPVGSPNRAEFSIIGDVVNLSARLMVAAQQKLKPLPKGESKQASTANEHHEEEEEEVLSDESDEEWDSDDSDELQPSAGVGAGAPAGGLRVSQVMDADEQLYGMRILVDKRTSDLCSHLEYRTLPPFAVKGKKGLQTVYQPTGASTSREALASTLEELDAAGACSRRRRRKLCGRLAEQAFWAAMQAQHMRDPCFNMVVIQGEAGYGKSLLVDHFVSEIEDRSMRLISLYCLPSHTDSVLPVWAQFLRGCHSLEPLPKPPFPVWARALLEPQRTPRRGSHGDNSKGMEPFLPLLADLGFVWPASDMTDILEGEDRRQACARLLVALTTRIASRWKLLLVVEDCHWMGPASWSIFRQLQRNHAPMLALLTLRPPSGIGATESLGRGTGRGSGGGVGGGGGMSASDASPNTSRLAAVQDHAMTANEPESETAGASGDVSAGSGSTGTTVGTVSSGAGPGNAEAAKSVCLLVLAGARLAFNLQRLPPAELLELACSVLQVKSLDPRLVETLTARSEGVPLFAVEFLEFIRSEELVDVDASGKATMTKTVTRIPHSVESMVIFKLDRLAPLQLRVLQAAAVLGFELALESLFPLLLGVPQHKETRRTSAVGSPGGRSNSRAALMMTRSAVAFGADPRRQIKLIVRDLTQIGGILEPTGHGRFRFHHVVMRDVVYRLTSYENRRKWHMRAAYSLMDSATSQRAIPTLVARHFELGGALDLAWRLHIVSAENALTASDVADANGHMESASTLQSQLTTAPSMWEMAYMHFVRALVEWAQSDMVHFRSQALQGLALMNLPPHPEDEEEGTMDASRCILEWTKAIDEAVEAGPLDTENQRHTCGVGVRVMMNMMFYHLRGHGRTLSTVYYQSMSVILFERSGDQRPPRNPYATLMPLQLCDYNDPKHPIQGHRTRALKVAQDQDNEVDVAEFEHMNAILPFVFRHSVVLDGVTDVACLHQLRHCITVMEKHSVWVTAQDMKSSLALLYYLSYRWDDAIEVAVSLRQHGSVHPRMMEISYRWVCQVWLARGEPAAALAEEEVMEEAVGAYVRDSVAARVQQCVRKTEAELLKVGELSSLQVLEHAVDELEANANLLTLPWFHDTVSQLVRILVTTTLPSSLASWKHAQQEGGKDALLSQGQSLLQRVMDVADTVIAEATPDVVWVMGHLGRAWLLWLNGDEDGATLGMQSALMHARSNGHRLSVAHMQLVQADMRGVDTEAGQDLIEAAADAFDALKCEGRRRHAVAKLGEERATHCRERYRKASEAAASAAQAVTQTESQRMRQPMRHRQRETSLSKLRVKPLSSE